MPLNVAIGRFPPHDIWLILPVTRLTLARLPWYLGSILHQYGGYLSQLGLTLAALLRPRAPCSRIWRLLIFSARIGSSALKRRRYGPYIIIRSLHLGSPLHPISAARLGAACLGTRLRPRDYYLLRLHPSVSRPAAPNVPPPPPSAISPPRLTRMLTGRPNV
ncbi:hypothetical protein R3P38DRAFT_3179334 [Favolaschia claudopus]|uniref:Uncharacterized protein n=1 Tax=Favolaschia claudopus TaxID=2862362 RepID=A0AAW0CSP0_9AGAR